MTTSLAAEGKPDEAARDYGSAAQFLSVTLQFGLVLVLMYRFRIQDGFGFLRLAPLLFVGFVAHGLMPRRLRLPFFTLLSIASIAVVVPYPHSLSLIGAAFGLIGPTVFAVDFWRNNHRRVRCVAP